MPRFPKDFPYPNIFLVTYYIIHILKVYVQIIYIYIYIKSKQRSTDATFSGITNKLLTIYMTKRRYY